MTESALAELPSVADAPLPVSYQAAKQALADCDRLDECKEWADKAQAMASYAKQAKDDSLRKYALRIQARASRRAGELYQQIAPANGTRSDLQPDEGDNIRLTREQIAADAGLSEWQRNTINRIANIPEQDFEDAIDSDNPPSITALAEQGKVSRAKPLVDLNGIDPADFARATEAQGSLKRLADFCKAHDAGRIAKSYQPHEINSLREHLSIVTEWLARFSQELPE